MSKGSGGTRSIGTSKVQSSSFAPVKETDKAVMVRMNYYLEYAPQGGFTSSMVRDREGIIDIWVPKSQVKDGKLSEWIVKQKQKEMEEKVMGKVLNGQVLDSKVSFSDKNGKQIKMDTSQAEKRFAAGKAKHDALVAEAKSLGIKGVKQNLKSSTLEKMISEKKTGVTKTTTTSSFDKSATKINAGSTVVGKHGPGTITRVITKSSGYVEVKYANGTIRKEMAFNLKGEDGKYLKNKPKR